MVISITRVVGQEVYFCSPRCKMLYQRVVETSTTESEQKRTTEPGLIMQDNVSAAPHSQKRQRDHEEEFDENPAHFRRVRLRYSDQSPEPESTQAAQETDISPNGNLKTSRNEAASPQADSFEQMTGVIASTSTDSASTFYADAELSVPDAAASTTSKSPAAKDDLFFTYSSPPEEDLRHPIGGSYIPNALLFCSSNEEEKPDWYDRTVFGTPPAEDDEDDRGSFFYSDSYLGENHAAPEQLLSVQSVNRYLGFPHMVTFSKLMIDPRTTRRTQ